jgi:D-alanyl-D-alanine carboxypeptidase/D-alanyl-D-alanine-endopeptidase (penicillin-binding protein 4)
MLSDLSRAARWASVAMCALALACRAGAAAPDCPPPEPVERAGDLPASLADALALVQISPDDVSFVVMPRDAGAPALAWNADTARPPASTIKLLTSAVALERLGPAFRWHTRLLADATPADGTVRGPLYVQGGGDPGLRIDDLRTMLAQLRAQGVTTLAGDIVLDRGAFEPARPDLIGGPFDGSPDADYNVVPDALLLESNLLTLHADTRGTPRFAVLPPFAEMAVDASGLQWASDLACDHWDDGWKAPDVTAEPGHLVLHLHGTLGRGCVAQLQTNVMGRDLYWEQAIARLWAQAGGRWAGRVRDGRAPASAVALVDHASEELIDAVRRMNKSSLNATARAMLMSLAPPSAKRSSLDTGRASADAWLREHAIRAKALVLDNGSGLSRTERISALQLAAVLRAAGQGPWAAEFESSLPIVGIDGTMRNRLTLACARGRARIKTGTLDAAVGVAGYVTDAARRRWIVVGLVDTPDAMRGRPALDTLIDWVARGGAIPTKPLKAAKPAEPTKPSAPAPH